MPSYMAPNTKEDEHAPGMAEQSYVYSSRPFASHASRRNYRIGVDILGHVMMVSAFWLDFGEL